MPIISLRRVPMGRGAFWPCKRRWAMRASCRSKWITSICTARAPAQNDAMESRRGGAAVRVRPAVRFQQGRDRTLPGRGGRYRSGPVLAAAVGLERGTGPAAACLGWRDGPGSGPAGVGSTGKPSAETTTILPQQFLLLRRQQCVLAHRPPLSAPFSCPCLIPSRHCCRRCGRMVLLDKVLEVGEDHIVAELDRARRRLVFRAGAHGTGLGRPGIHGASRRRLFRLSPQTGGARKSISGFLLGTRYYQCSVERFSLRRPLARQRRKRSSRRQRHVGVRLPHRRGQHSAARSKLNVLLPQDSKKFLAGKGV